MKLMSLSAAAVAAAGLLAAAPTIAQERPRLEIPASVSGPKRDVTTRDLALLRDLDSISVAPDGERFAILVRQARPELNTYITAWYQGTASGAPLRYLADGGEAMQILVNSHEESGEFGAGLGRWSPDGRSFAFLSKRDGQVQVWVVDAKGRSRQVTRNAADVRDFVWSADSRRILFKVGSTRDILADRQRVRYWEGVRIADYRAQIFAATRPELGEPLETDLAVWRVDVSGRAEQKGSSVDAEEFARQSRASMLRGGVEMSLESSVAALRPPVTRADGASVWLEKTDARHDGPMPLARVTAKFADGQAIACADNVRCVGQFIRDVWWVGDEVVIWSVDGATDHRNSLYVWSPRTNTARTLMSLEEQFLAMCEAVGKRVFCTRETPLEPRHVVAYDVASGAMAKVADVNPEMAQFKLGRVDYIEWDTGPDVANMGYSPRSRGFILYPPDYDPSRTYPLYVAPYTNDGFLRGDVGNEHPLLVYAANGFVVLNSAFPLPIRTAVDKSYLNLMNVAYDPKLGYPHVSTYARTTFAGIDMAMTRANIDTSRIGIGGVSHGSFVPLHMVLTSDRIAAWSGANSWSEMEYYAGQKLPEPFAEPSASWKWPEDPEFWRPIDISQHLDKIEAPLLFQIPDTEVHASMQFLRRLSDAHMAYDAYVFDNETHQKWQPAHRFAVYNRNVDWFRFWLQDVEDPDPSKAAQYERWRKLRELQCRNRLSLRSYCNVSSTQRAVAH